ncbi:hypothetical protein EOPP23_18785 [Endozoicomonas sp. OPT23]|nr:hypothetical protein [Endozoicomonas sp. OPT23]
MYIYDGHASFELTKTDNSRITAGFYPASTTSLVTGEGRIEKESYRAEAEDGGWPLVRISLTNEQADNAHEKFSQYLDWCTTGDERCYYNPITHNCVDFVQDIYQSAEQGGHWLSHFNNDQMTKYGGIANGFIAMTNKPYELDDTVSDRMQSWTRNRTQGLLQDPHTEISSNIMLVGVLIGAAGGLYSGCKSLMTYAGKTIASYTHQQHPEFSSEEMHEFIEKGMLGLKKVSRSIEYLLDYSGDETCYLELRNQVIGISVNLDEQLGELEQSIKLSSTSKSSTLKMEEIIKKIDYLSEKYLRLSETIEKRPAEIIGKEIRGSLEKTRAALNTVLDHLSCYRQLTHLP